MVSSLQTKRNHNFLQIDVAPHRKFFLYPQHDPRIRTLSLHVSLTKRFQKINKSNFAKEKKMTAPVVQYGTVKQHYDACIRTYREKVLDSTLSSTDPQFQSVVTQLIAELELVWHTVQGTHVLSPNDELDDVSTGTLSILLTPFVLADLHQRVVLPPQPLLSQTSSAAAHSSQTGSRSRSHALALSIHHLQRFLQVAVQLGLATEPDVEQSVVYQPQQRQRRVDMSRAVSGMQSTLRSMESRMSFLAARRQRMKKLIAEEEDSDNDEDRGADEAQESKARAAAGKGSDAIDEDAERGAEEDELLREYHLLRLRCAVLESYQSIQMSTRELEMLTTLTDDQRREIVQEYQKQLQESGGGLGLQRQTYTILPGGSIAPGAVGLRQAGGTSTGASTISSSSSYALPSALLSQQYGITVDGRTVRETIQSEIFMDRNRPTMTLQEFAEMEMREVQRQMQAAQEQGQWQAEEDKRLGPEGMEERDRKKDSAWADWKDDNPPIGLSTKGNYS